MARLKTAKKKINLLAGQSFVFWHCLNLIISMCLLRNKEVNLLHTKWNHVMLTETATIRAVTTSCRLEFQLAVMSKEQKDRTKGKSSCQSQKTVNNWKISGILIVYWPIKIKFRTREQTSKQQTNYRCCWRFSYPCLIGLFLATQEHSINISSVHGFLSFTVTVEFPPTNCPNSATWNLSDSPDNNCSTKLLQNYERFHE